MPIDVLVITTLNGEYYAFLEVAKAFTWGKPKSKRACLYLAGTHASHSTWLFLPDMDSNQPMKNPIGRYDQVVKR